MAKKKAKKVKQVKVSKKPIKKKVNKQEKETKKNEVKSALDIINEVKNQPISDSNSSVKKATSYSINNVKEKIKEQEIADVLEERMPVYGMSIILDRALCDIDGLKPIQRRILWALY